jgi:Protein of unknown function (DUF3987)
VTEKHVREVLDRAALYVPPEPIGPEPPRPLTREIGPAPVFPVAALGSVLGGAAEAIYDKVQAPQAICAQSVLGAAALAAQRQADVILPTGQTRPLSVYLISIAASGERKSSADIEALAPVQTYEARLRETYDAALPGFQNRRDVWEQQRRVILADRKRDDREAKIRALEALGSSPEPPLRPVLLMTEPTLAGLHKLLAEGQPGVGIFSAEGGQFLSGHGMSAEHKIQTAAGLSELWDGGTVRRVRAEDGASILPGRRLSMHLMVQPDIGAALMADLTLADQGLPSRMLPVAPASMAGVRLFREPKPQSEAALQRYKAALLALLECPLPLSVGKRNNLDPRQLPLSLAARAAWIAYADHTEKKLAAGGVFEPIRPLGNKLAEHAARLAGMLALCDDPQTEEICEKKLASGVILAEYFAAEALRLREAGRVAPDLRLAQRVLAWLTTDWSEPLVSLPDLYRHGPYAIHEASVARRIANILVSHGWLVSVDGVVTVNGTPRREAWKIVRGVR